MSGTRQLGLPFEYRPEFAHAAFLEAPSNEAALAWLGCTQDWPGGRLALWGQAGCGKTHLLHLWAARAGGRVVDSTALNVGPVAGPLALDDAESAAAGNEQGLLHALNAAAEDGQAVLLAARHPPSRWAVGLPDLASRLRAVTAVEIEAAEESLLSALLSRLLAERQIVVAPAIQAWLLLRLPRTPAAMREAAARLDRLALETGGAISRPIAAAALEEIAGEAG